MKESISSPAGQVADRNSIEQSPLLLGIVQRGLEDSSPAGFARTLRDASKSWNGGSNPKQCVIEALMAVAGSPSISEIEQNRRATLIMDTVPKHLLIDDAFLTRLGELPRYVKNGIACSLPAECRPIFFGKGAKGTKIPTVSSRPSDEPTASRWITVRTNQERQKSREGIVLLLASRMTQEVEANLSLLHRDDFPAFRVSSEEELNVYLGKSDVCGFVIDGSFWEGRSGEEQKELLERTAAYSSMACLVVDETNFAQPGSIRLIIDGQRIAQATYHEIQVRTGSRLASSDLECFRRSADRLAPQSRPQLLLKEFTDCEIVAVTAAAAAFLHDELACREPIAELGFASMAGGKSGAKVVQMYFGGYELPVIVKVHCKEFLVQEAERYCRYIAMRGTNAYLKPYVYFHGNIGVAIFSLVGDSTEINAPAIKLEDRMHRAWLQEPWGNMGSGLTLGENCEVIEHVAKQAAERLAFINKIRCPYPHEHEPYGYLKGDGMQNLLSNGVKWSFPTIQCGSVQTCIERAHKILDRVGDIATIHGDVHLRNILCQDRNAYLIDYSCSGPGHPACDLVRLECALLFGYLRQLDTEEAFVDLQHAVSFDIVGLDELERRFPVWFSSRLNRSLLTGVISCRDACLSVLSAYSADVDQYRAAKFIMACRSTDVFHLQMGLIRGTIRALAPEFSSLPTEKGQG